MRAISSPTGPSPTEISTSNRTREIPLMTVEERKSVVERGRPSGGEFARRVVILIFGLIQVLIALRFVLLLLNAREGNSIVKGILDLSQLFVAPFDGILRTDALHASGSTLDITAIVAFVGWTIVELIVIWAVSIFRREPD
jgi:YGGT family